MEHQEQKINEELLDFGSNQIKIGDIFLMSNNISINELADLLLALLKTPEIKEYLDIVKVKKTYTPSYVEGGAEDE